MQEVRNQADFFFVVVKKKVCNFMDRLVLSNDYSAAETVWVKGLSSLLGAGRAALSGVGRAHVFGRKKAKRGFAPYGDSRFRDDVGIVPYNGGLCLSTSEVRACE